MIMKPPIVDGDLDWRHRHVRRQRGGGDRRGSRSSFQKVGNVRNVSAVTRRGPAGRGRPLRRLCRAKIDGRCVREAVAPDDIDRWMTSLDQRLAGGRTPRLPQALEVAGMHPIKPSSEFRIDRDLEIDRGRDRAGDNAKWSTAFLAVFKPRQMGTS